MSELDLDKPNEAIDYQLIPEIVDDEQLWKVRLLRAPFDQTTIRFKNVQIDSENERLTFNFTIVEGDDFTEDNAELQEFAAAVLSDIINTAVKEGWLGTRETDDGNKSTTDDSSESTD